MFRVLKRTVSMRRFFRAPKTYAKLWVRKCLQFHAENFCLSIPMLVYFRYQTLHTNKEEGKDQESIQSSITPDPGHQMGK